MRLNFGVVCNDEGVDKMDDVDVTSSCGTDVEPAVKLRRDLVVVTKDVSDDMLIVVGFCVLVVTSASNVVEPIMSVGVVTFILISFVKVTFILDPLD